MLVLLHCIVVVLTSWGLNRSHEVRAATFIPAPKPTSTPSAWICKQFHLVDLALERLQGKF